MLKILRFIALAGLTLSICVHLLSWFLPTAINRIPGLMLLHFPVVLFGIPTILIYAKTQKNYQDEIQKSKGIPVQELTYFISKPVIFIVIYAILHFFISMAYPFEGTPEYVNGEYFLQNHGKIIRYITKSEYILEKHRVLRSFSSFWLIGYSIEFEIFRYCLTLRKRIKLLQMTLS